MALADLLAPALQIGATIMSAGSQLVRANAYQAIGARRQAAANFEATQLEREAERSSGIGMNQAQNAALQTLYINSKAQDAAAASGGGALDPTVVDIISRNAGEGAYRQAVAMYEGESQARLNIARAQATRYEGGTAAADADAARTAAQFGAANTLLTGGVKLMSMRDKYWPD
jgi:hypothetical protein